MNTSIRIFSSRFFFIFHISIQLISFVISFHFRWKRSDTLSFIPQKVSPATFFLQWKWNFGIHCTNLNISSMFVFFGIFFWGKQNDESLNARNESDKQTKFSTNSWCLERNLNTRSLSDDSNYFSFGNDLFFLKKYFFQFLFLHQWRIQQIENDLIKFGLKLASFPLFFYEAENKTV